MSIQTQDIDYQHQGAALRGYLAYDDATAQPLPAVLVAHSWVGRDALVCQKARDIAALGYAAFALDMYGAGIVGRDVDECAALMQPWLDDREALQDRMQTALATVRGLDRVDHRRIAAVGYCFGGLCALDLARSGADLNACVSIHGLFTPASNTTGQTIKAKVLALHGHDDPMVPVEAVHGLQQELSAAGADWQIYVYGGTQHAFTNPQANDPAMGTVYNPNAERRSWQALQNFLQEAFQ